VVLILPTGYEPDGRLAGVKMIKKAGRAIEFTPQTQGLLIDWIKRRFAAMGKTIGNAECERLIFISGNRMTGLVPEIEKIGSFAKGEKVSEQDIESLAQHIPEAKVFEMTDCLAGRRYDAAAALLAELLQSGEHPIKTLAMIGFQMRRLYTARVAIDSKLGRDFVMKTHDIKSSYVAEKLMESAAKFTTNEVIRAVELCAESDYRIKSSSQKDEDILKELLIRMAAGGAA
jgi:DNA polymerase-3 subunit delta